MVIGILVGLVIFGLSWFGVFTVTRMTKASKEWEDTDE